MMMMVITQINTDDDSQNDNSYCRVAE